MPLDLEPVLDLEPLTPAAPLALEPLDEQSPRTISESIARYKERIAAPELKPGPGKVQQFQNWLAQKLPFFKDEEQHLDEIRQGVSLGDPEAMDMTPAQLAEKYPGLKTRIYGPLGAPTDFPMTKWDSEDVARLFPPGEAPGATTKAVVAGTQNAAAGLTDFFTSELGIATLMSGGVLAGAGGTSAAANAANWGRAQAAGFATDMLAHAPEQASALAKAIESGDPQAITREGINSAGHMAFMYGLGQHAATPFKETIPPLPPDEAVPVAPRPEAPPAEPITESVSIGNKSVEAPKLDLEPIATPEVAPIALRPEIPAEAAPVQSSEFDVQSSKLPPPPGEAIPAPHPFPPGTPLEIDIDAGTGPRTLKAVATPEGVQVGDAGYTLPWTADSLLAVREIKPDTSPKVESNVAAKAREVEENLAAMATLRAAKEQQPAAAPEVAPAAPRPEIPAVEPVQSSEFDVQSSKLPAADLPERPWDLIDDITSSLGVKLSLRSALAHAEDFKPTGELKKLFTRTGGDGLDDVLSGLHQMGLARRITTEGELLDAITEAHARREGWTANMQRINAGESGLPSPHPMGRGTEGEVSSGALGTVGMGGAKPAEFSVPQLTSIKNETVDRERAERGLPPAMQAARRSFDTIWDEAMQAVDDGPQKTDDLIEELKTKPRALTDIEDALLLHRQIELQNEYGKAARDMAMAHDDAGQFPERRADFEAEKLRLARLSDQLVELYDVNKSAGTETGRGLAARKMLAHEDYTLAKMEVDLRAAQDGAPLTEVQRKQLGEAHAKINETQAALDEALARLDHEKALRAGTDATNDLIDRVRQDPEVDPAVRSIAERITLKLESAADAARARLKARLARTSAGVDPQIVADLAIVGAAHIARGALEFGKWSLAMLSEFGNDIAPYLKEAWTASNRRVDDAVDSAAAGPKRDKVARTVRKLDTRVQREALVNGMKEARFDGRPNAELGRFIQRLAETFVRDGIKDRDKLVDTVHQLLVLDFDSKLTRRQTMDAISGYGDFKQLNPDAVKAQLRELKGQMQQVAKLEDIQSKAPLKKTGIERRTIGDEERRLIQQVNEAKKKFGVVTTDPARQLKGALDAIKTRMRNRIADLKFETASKTKIVREKSAVKFDAEAEALKMELKAAQEEHAKIFERPDLTDEQRLALATRSVEASTKEYEQRLAARDASPLNVIGKPPKSAALEALRARRDALRTEFRELQNADAGIQAARAAVRNAVAMKNARTGIDALTQRINEGPGGGTSSASPKLTTPELTALRDERAALWKMVHEMEKSARDVKSPEARALSALKTRMANSTADYLERTARDDFSPRLRRPVTLDAEATRLKVANQNAKQAWQRKVVEQRLAQRPVWIKGLDVFTRWRRGFLLSSPVTLAKLTAAAVARGVSTPIEEGVGAVLGQLPGVRQVARRAPREGGLNVRAEARAITQGLTQGMTDAWHMLWTGKSSLETLHGRGRDGAVAEHDVVPASAIDLFGHIHGALKAPLKRSEFARSLEKRTAHAMASGVDVSDPLVQTKLSIEAYKDANRAIFLEDNRVLSAYQRGLRALEEPNKATGRVPVAGKLATTAARTLLPIVRVPTNVVAQTLQYAVGSLTGSARLALALRRGVETLHPEEADLIMRELKRGTIGGMALVTGYLLSQSIGGYYQTGQRRDPSKPKPGSLRIGDLNVDKSLLHNPLLETLQIGADIHHVAASKLRRRDRDTQGAAAGAVHAAFSLAEEVPFIREMLDLSHVTFPGGLNKTAGEFTKSLVVPQALQWTARQLDPGPNGEPMRRDPHTLTEHLKTGLPLLRNRVPPKVERRR